MTEKLVQQVDHQQNQPADPSKRKFLAEAGRVLRVLAYGTLGMATIRALDKFQKNGQPVSEHVAAQSKPMVLDSKSLLAIQAGEAYPRQDRVAVNLRFGMEQALVIALATIAGLRAIRLEEGNRESQILSKSPEESPEPAKPRAERRSEWIL